MLAREITNANYFFEKEFFEEHSTTYGILPSSAGEPGMSIAIESIDELEQICTRLHKMSVDELRRFAKAARRLCRHRDCSDTFKR